MGLSEWVCPHCSFRNHIENVQCGGNGPMGCNAPKPPYLDAKGGKGKDGKDKGGWQDQDAWNSGKGKEKGGWQDGKGKDWQDGKGKDGQDGKGKDWQDGK